MSAYRSRVTKGLMALAISLARRRACLTRRCASQDSKKCYGDLHPLARRQRSIFSDKLNPGDPQARFLDPLRDR